MKYLKKVENSWKITVLDEIVIDQIEPDGSRPIGKVMTKTGNLMNPNLTIHYKDCADRSCTKGFLFEKVKDFPVLSNFEKVNFALGDKISNNLLKGDYTDVELTDRGIVHLSSIIERGFFQNSIDLEDLIYLRNDTHVFAYKLIKIIPGEETYKLFFEKIKTKEELEIAEKEMWD